MGRGMKRLGRPETGPEEGVGTEVIEDGLAEILTASAITRRSLPALLRSPPSALPVSPNLPILECPSL